MSILCAEEDRVSNDTCFFRFIIGHLLCPFSSFGSMEDLPANQFNSCKDLLEKKERRLSAELKVETHLNLYNSRDKITKIIKKEIREQGTNINNNEIPQGKPTEQRTCAPLAILHNQQQKKKQTVVITYDNHRHQIVLLFLSTSGFISRKINKNE